MIGKLTFGVVLAVCLTSEAFAAKGTLVVRSSVRGAQVLLNGLDAGVTPLKAMKLRPGKYRVEIKRLGFMPFRKRVKVTSGSTSMVKATLRPVAGVVQIRSNVPGAQVMVAGEDVGTVDSPIEIGIGQVELQIIAPGYEVLSFKVDAVPGKWVTRRVTLVAASGGLELDTLELDPGGGGMELNLELEPDPAPAIELELDLSPTEPEPKADVAASAVTPMPAVDGTVSESGQWYTNPWIWTGTGAVIVSAVVTGILMTQRPDASPYDAVIQLD